MIQRPLIGVPTQTLQAIDDIPEWLPPSWVMNQRYLTTLVRSGALPLMVPLFEDEALLRAAYDRLDGLFLAGGIDVDPGSYGEERDSSCGRIDPPRDRAEIALTRWAVEDGMPFLGVCRGLQILNVASGGTLYQDTTLFHPNAIKHDYFPTAGFARDHLAHEVEIRPDTVLAGIYGSAAVLVNSMHHQGIRELGHGLRVSATAPDGLVEALEGEDGAAYRIAVQWHPEMLYGREAGTRRLFESFVEAAGAWRASLRFDPVG